jgi:hypothetical protein
MKSTLQNQRNLIGHHRTDPAFIGDREFCTLPPLAKGVVGHDPHPGKEPSMYRKPSRSDSFTERIAQEKRRLEVEMAKAQPGPARDGLEKKLRQLDIASHLNEWLTSPGLQSPR